ncbi:MAG: TIGR02186 family protein [Alphaproteobacteria bacterium]|nr:TIGR02186 family protein [Alphaproteobacteria bacterium]
MRRWFGPICLVAALWGMGVAASRPAAAQGLVADLSSHLIAITTDFTGQELLLFGTLDDPSRQDVVVVVTGPQQTVTVRQKKETLGVWINRRFTTFEQVPTFYRVAASNPLAEILTERALDRGQIGLRNLELSQASGSNTFREELERFREAFIRRQVESGLYADQVDPVRFVGGRLFRTTIGFPANVPTGQYIVTAYLVENGDIVDAQTTPLIISKLGIGADVSVFAYRQSLLYGIVAVVIAMMAGWTASWIFRRL